MDREFVAVRTVGRWRDRVEDITRAVRTLQLSRLVPFVRPEKRASREFYVFLSINGSYRDPATKRQVDDLLRAAGLGKGTGPLTRAEINGMASPTEFEIRSVDMLRRKFRRERDLSDPFDILGTTGIHVEESSSASLAIESSYQWLVALASAAGNGSRQSIARACESLGLVGEYQTPPRIIRNLKLLGILETTKDGERWTICPPTLVELAADSGRYFLAGARSPRLENAVAEKWEVEYTSQPFRDGPQRILVNCGRLEDMETIQVGGFTLVIAGCSSEALAGKLPHISEWADRLVEIKHFVPSEYYGEFWDGESYVRFEGVIESGGEILAPPGLYRFTHSSDGRKVTLYLRKNDSAKWLRGDWYGLRFFDLHNAGQTLMAGYDSEKYRFVMAKNNHLPLLYERSLILSSGLLPTRGDNWLAYEGVTQTIIDSICQKTTVEIQRNA